MAAPKSLKGTCGSLPRGKQRPGPVNDRRRTTGVPRDLNPAPRGKMGTPGALVSGQSPGLGQATKSHRAPPTKGNCYFFMSCVTLS